MGAGGIDRGWVGYGAAARTGHRQSEAASDLYPDIGIPVRRASYTKGRRTHTHATTPANVRVECTFQNLTPMCNDS